ncbi:MAG TPA: hypothetical protein VGB66_05960, partial [Longimicrobium sp.]
MSSALPLTILEAMRTSVSRTVLRTPVQRRIANGFAPAEPMRLGGGIDFRPHLSRQAYRNSITHVNVPLQFSASSAPPRDTSFYLE